MRAMVLAAGLGTRMRHLTADRPKPMVPVLGRPLIDRTLDRLGEIGVGEAVVNLHYRPDMLRAHVSGRKAPGRGDAPSAPYVFTGAQILSPSLFDDVPEGPFSLNLVWDRAIAAGRAFGIVHPGAWCDVGTPEGLAEAEEALG